MVTCIKTDFQEGSLCFGAEGWSFYLVGREIQVWYRCRFRGISTQCGDELNSERWVGSTPRAGLCRDQCWSCCNLMGELYLGLVDLQGTGRWVRMWDGAKLQTNGEVTWFTSVCGLIWRSADSQREMLLLPWLSTHSDQAHLFAHDIHLLQDLAF